MDKGDKDDPTSPNRNNLFENAAANLLGLSPFGLPYASHLAHLPGAFLMGQHPAFPVTSLFGGLGDGMLGHFPTSLAASTAAYNSLFSSASKGSPQQKSSPKSTSRSPASSSSSSAKTTITKATTTIATNTTSSCTNSISKKTFTTPVVAGTTGVSLLSGKVKKSPGRPPKGDSTSSSQISSKSNGSIVSSPSYSTNTASGLFSPPTKSALNISTKQQKKENGILDTDSHSDISSGSSSLSDDSSLANGDDKAKCDSKNMEATDLSTKQNSGPTIHIDGLKKKLIADQIRQRVQSKPMQNTTPSILHPMKRGRGRPPKSSSKDGVSIEDIHEYKKQQEELKKQFEANLKEQQMQLKMFKKAQQLKDMETSAKINQLLEAHASLGKSEADDLCEGQSVSHGMPKLKTKSLQASIEKLKAASKSASESKNTSPTHKSRLSSPTHRQKVTSPTGSQKSSPTHKLKLGSPTHNKHREEPMSPTMLSPNERSKLFAETLFNKIRMETEQDNSDENVLTRVRTESGQDHTQDELETSDSDGSNDDDSDDRTGESDACNMSLKRSADEMSEDTCDGSSVKRPRVQTDERELKVPLERGWKRSTTILAIGKRGFIGEVLYFSPCGKKMKTIPDVMRYIEKHVITNLGRENFSFNTRVNVGEFFEQRSEENGTVKLTQEEIAQRMALIESKRQKLRKLKEQRGKKKSEKQNKQIMLAKQMMEQKFKKKVEQQALEKKKQQEQLRLLKEQEKLQRQEQMRMDRELRAQQILEVCISNQKSSSPPLFVTYL